MKGVIRQASAYLNMNYHMHVYLSESVYKVVLQKSIPAQIRQLILYISNNKG